jgi:hypothetical protein
MAAALNCGLLVLTPFRLNAGPLPDGLATGTFTPFWRRHPMYFVSACLKTEPARREPRAVLGLLGCGVVDLDVVDPPVEADVDVLAVLGADVDVVLAVVLVAVALEELPVEPPQAASPKQANVRIDRMAAAGLRRVMLTLDMKLLFR